MTAAAPLSRSTNVACAAPRDSASIPAAPEPANRSRTLAPGRSGSRIAKSVCLTRSASGRVAGPGASSRMPAGRPGDDPAGVPGRRHAPLAGSPAGHPPQPAVVELGGQGRPRRGHPAVGVEQRLGMRSRPDGQLAMLGDLERRDPEAREAALGETEDVALLAQLEVLLGELEPVVRLDDRAQARHRDLVGRVGHQDAERFDAAAPDPAAQLVELGQAEPVGALDDHHRRGRHVDPDLDDRRADQDVQLAVAEAAHLGVALGGLEPAVDHPDTERVEQRGQPDRLALGGDRAIAVVDALLDQRHHDERPVPERRLVPDLAPRAVEVGRALDPGPDLDPARGRRPEVGHVEVRVQDLAERPRDGRRGHQQDVRRAAAGLGLELAALVHPEPMLLVDDDEAEVGER